MIYNFCKGDRVQVLNTDQVGEIIAIQNGQATITFNYLTITLPLQEIKFVANNSLAPKNTFSYPKKRFTNASLDMYKFLAFQPKLDLHGLSIEEALHTLDKWLDQAILNGHSYLQIIHGKGKGLLRQAVHKYLKKHELVNKIITNHNLPGGNGITIVEI